MAVIRSNRRNKIVRLCADYPDRADYIYQELYKLKSNKTWPLFRLPSPTDAGDRMEDLALIVGSYEENSSKIAATKSALEWLIKSKPKPHIFFVEAVREGITGDFKEYEDRLNYIPQTLTNESNNLNLKEVLWTIGANAATSSAKKITKLCFLDPAVEFVDQLWALEVSKTLEQYDVISPHAYTYMEGSNTTEDPIASIGQVYPDINQEHTFKYGIACTTKFFKQQLNGKIDATAVSCDYHWYTILGISFLKYDRDRLPYHYTHPKEMGVRPFPSVGHANLLMGKRDYKDDSDKLLDIKTKLLKRAVYTPFREYSYSKNSLPVWSPTSDILVLSRVYEELAHLDPNTVTIDTAWDLYKDSAILEYGAIDEEHPFVVVCVLSKHSDKTVDDVLALKDQLEQRCKVDYRFICVTEETIEGVECIIPSIDLPEYVSVVQAMLSLELDKDTSVLYLDLNTTINRDIYPHRCPEDTVAYIRAHEINSPVYWGVWSCKAVYYRGDYKDILTEDYKDLDYQYSGVEELLTGKLTAADIYPTSIEQHFCTRYYNKNKEYPEAELLVR